MSELIKVFIESSAHAEPIALFNSDEAYNDCLPGLERWANEGGLKITESVNETGLVYLVFASLLSGEHINKVMYDFTDLQRYLEKTFLTGEDQGIKDDYHRRFDDARVKSLAHEESYWFEFDTGVWVTITATNLL